MSDADLRRLEREGREAPRRTLERQLWRAALVRSGLMREAGFERGDRVLVVREGRVGEVCQVLKTRIKVRISFQRFCTIPTFRTSGGWTRQVVLLEPGGPFGAD